MVENVRQRFFTQLLFLPHKFVIFFTLSIDESFRICVKRHGGQLQTSVFNWQPLTFFTPLAKYTFLPNQAPAQTVFCTQLYLDCSCKTPNFFFLLLKPKLSDHKTFKAQGWLKKLLQKQEVTLLPKSARGYLSDTKIFCEGILIFRSFSSHSKTVEATAMVIVYLYVQDNSSILQSPHFKDRVLTKHFLKPRNSIPNSNSLKSVSASKWKCLFRSG